MAKTTKKKKNRKLKRQIRKTVGALLMVSAITVAAIPVQDVRADEDGIATHADTGAKIQVLNYDGAGTSDRVELQNDTGADLSSIMGSLGSSVPIIGKNDTIYETGDSSYQFAFLQPQGGGDFVAVILRANINNLPDDGTLTIPKTLDAYKKFSTNASGEGYCAVGRKGEYLYYKAKEQKEDSFGQPLYAVMNGVTDVNDPDYLEVSTSHPNVKPDATTSSGYTYEYTYMEDGETKTGSYNIVPVMIESIRPCFYSSYDAWIKDADETNYNLYYWKDEGTKDKEPDLTKEEDFIKASISDNDHVRIHDAAVRYIGSQYITANTSTSFGVSAWKIGDMVTEDNPWDGVFAGKTQIHHLIIEENTLLGIGDYAFYGDGGLNSVKFSNGLNTIGNGAFQGCNNLRECNMVLRSELPIIGKRAFSGCSSLSSITIPIGVVAIGDYCFENCTALETIDLCGGSENLQVQLKAIGYKAFAGCSSLSSITFPVDYYDFENGVIGKDNDSKAISGTGIPITYFEGCTSLQFVKVQNRQFSFIDPTSPGHMEDLTCDIGKFLKTVSGDFYFEGPSGDTSKIHVMAKKHSAAFKYLNEDVFEKVIWCPETEYDDDGDIKDDTGHECTFRVDSNNRLIDMDIDRACGIVEIPANIGAGHGIETIGSSSFQNNCSLIKITIPPTVKYIESDAFKGCHNLKHVIFSEPINIESIGSGAFNTQQVNVHGAGCNGTLSQEPSLSFTGVISPDSAPFVYAMDPASNINTNSQPTTYITFYSGWPTNLSVQYNPETDKNELIDYPTNDDLNNYVKWERGMETGDAPIPEGKKTFPYMTGEYVEAAAGAYKGGTLPVELAARNATQNITLPAGIEAISEGIFQENESLQSISMETVEKIDDYTFEDCVNLESVNVSAAVTEMGKRPFAGCGNLLGINFNDSTSFVCEEAVIYGLDENGAKSTIVECLETRGDKAGYYIVGPDELKGITSIYEEAFMNCANIGEVDLSASIVETIPKDCFNNSENITIIRLPSNVEVIEQGAFANTKRLRSLTIPGTQTYIAEDAFMTGDWVKSPADRVTDPGNTGQQTIHFECIENTYADRYAKQYWYLNPVYGKVSIQHMVYFMNYPDWSDISRGDAVLYDSYQVNHGEDAPWPSPDPTTNNSDYVFSGWSENYKNIVMDNTYVYANYSNKIWKVVFFSDGKTFKTEYVMEGKSATAPEEIPEREGYTFREWDNYSNIGVGLDYDEQDGTVWIMAQFDNNFSEENLCTVIFNLFDGSTNTMTEINRQTVPKGGDATAPSLDGRIPSGYIFTGWSGNLTNITQDTTFVGSLVRGNDGSGSGSGNGSGSNSGNGSSSGSGNSNRTPSPSATPTATPEPGSEVRKYTVSVSGGSGSGQYAAGEIVAINAYAMSASQVFDKWTSSTAGVGFADANATSTTFTMPAANVAVTATYKTGSGSSATVTNSGGSGGGNTVNTVTNNGTVVDVTRPGISNTNLAGATVSGATDNFVVKVTEDQAATDAVTAALQARYGDLSRIKYLPMDISLYDSTGRTRIADTSGISVNLTLPLPDDLIQYAGNNRVAAISGGALEDLNARFTTVGGVPCVNFTATHFSPYVIYVDTANLTEATIDTTPKTGDPIHPKWFLAIGLACISLILFFKRDRVVINTKAA